LATRLVVPDVAPDDAMFERVTIRTPQDIHDAAVALGDFASERGLRVAACSDIASKEPMVDADGGIINGEIFGWIADGERWWEDTRLALSSPLPRACRYEGEPFWCNADGFYGPWRNKYLEEMKLSKREVECLRWAAIGKTDGEISMILSRSHATVRYHVHRAGEKLNAVNRSQTVFKAGQLGYLGAAY